MHVKGNNLNTHGLQIGCSIVSHLFGKLFAIIDHLFKSHTANNLTSITFKNLLENHANLIRRHVQKVLGGELKHFGAVADLDINNCIDLYVDKVGSRHSKLSLNINGNQLKRHPVQAFQNRYLYACLSDQHSIAQTRNDVSSIRRSLNISSQYYQYQQTHNQAAKDIRDHTKFLLYR